MKMTPRNLAALVFLLPILAQAQFFPAEKPAALQRFANRDRAVFGYLSVPENRADPANLDRINLALIIVKARSASPQPDPVFYIVGGPGGSATLSSSGFPIFESVNADRDVVFVDPRGAGFSLPNLFLRLGGFTVAQFVDGNRSLFATEGIDVTAYNTTEIAQDYEDARLALGYGPVNLFANSYGTFVAQEMLRRHPASIRCAVMSGNDPATDPFIPTTLAIERLGIKALFRDVARDRRARAAFPKLKRHFYSLVRRLNRDPVVLVLINADTGQFERVVITGGEFLSEVTGLLQRTETIRLLPLLVQQMEQGRFSALPSRFFAPRRDLRIENPLGMYLSVLGADFAAPDYVRETERAIARLDNDTLKTTEGPGLIQLARIIVRWGVPFQPGTTRMLPASAVPTLFLNGKMDAQTPVTGGAQIAANFSNATNFVYPRIGHAVGFFAGPDRDAAVAFIGNPAAPPPFSLGRLLRRGFYKTSEPSRKTRDIDTWRDYLVDPPLHLDRLPTEP